MTKFMDKSFSSRPASKEYRDNWEKVFGKKSPERVAAEIFMDAFDKRYQVRSYSAGGFPISEEVADAVEDGLKRGVDYGMPVIVVKPKNAKRGKR